MTGFKKFYFSCVIWMLNMVPLWGSHPQEEVFFEGEPLSRQKFESDLEHKKRLILHCQLESIFYMSQGNVPQSLGHKIAIDRAIESMPEENKALNEYKIQAQRILYHSFLAENLIAKSLFDQRWDQDREKIVFFHSKKSEEGFNLLFNQSLSNNKRVTTPCAEESYIYSEARESKEDPLSQFYLERLRKSWKHPLFTNYYGKPDEYEGQEMVLRSIQETPIITLSILPEGGPFCAEITQVYKSMTIPKILPEGSGTWIDKESNSMDLKHGAMSFQRPLWNKEYLTHQKEGYVLELDSLPKNAVFDEIRYEPGVFLTSKNTQKCLLKADCFIFEGNFLEKGKILTLQPSSSSELSWIEYIEILPYSLDEPIFLQGEIDFTKDKFKKFGVANGSIKIFFQTEDLIYRASRQINHLYFFTTLNPQGEERLKNYTRAFKNTCYIETLKPYVITEIYLENGAVGLIYSNGNKVLSQKGPVKQTFSGPFHMSRAQKEEEFIENLKMLSSIKEIKRYTSAKQN